MANAAKAAVQGADKRAKDKTPKPLRLSRKKDTAASGPTLGTARGVESMLRNAYRAQLSMIALAATKANIMISVNGFLLSMLTLSSAYVLTTVPALLIPMAAFLLTCLVAIVFAVLAARPQTVDRSKLRPKDFRKGRADLLVFEQFSHLSKDEYMDAMIELMQDKERVYKAMVAHLHFLGRSADRRFRLLHVAYSAFFVGLIISAATLAVVVAIFLV